MLRIIDNKRINMEDGEYSMYENICRSYDRPSFKGEELFVGLFETDNSGTIVFINPPNKRFTSLEAYLFIVSIFNHQHMRLMHAQVDSLCADIREQIKNIK